MTAVKSIKVLGTSEESWHAAAEAAYENADKTIEYIRGIEVESWTAEAGDDGIEEYKATVEVAFPVSDEMR